MAEQAYLDTSRTGRVLGEAGVARLAAAHVCVFGVGGVGGHLCEALARAGVGKLTLVDGDCVSASNVNRQIIALQSTVGVSLIYPCRHYLHLYGVCVRIDDGLTKLIDGLQRIKVTLVT